MKKQDFKHIIILLVFYDQNYALFKQGGTNMRNELERVKTYLDSEVEMITTDEEKQKRIIVDNRFELMINYINLIENKDEYFYSELVKLISIYIDIW